MLFYSSTFEYNKNNVTWLGNTFPTSLITGIVVGIRFLVAFCGTNIFRSNYGGGINMNHARVTIDGKMLFYDNNKGAIGGAMRLGEVALVCYITLIYEVILWCFV